MVEQSPEKACVGGSIPSLATTNNGDIISSLAISKSIVSPERVFRHTDVTLRTTIPKSFFMNIF